MSGGGGGEVFRDIVGRLKECVTIVQIDRSRCLGGRSLADAEEGFVTTGTVSADLMVIREVLLKAPTPE